jgi:hypothetical protein
VDIKDREISRLHEEIQTQESFWRSQHDELVFHLQKTQEGVMTQENLSKEKNELLRTISEIRDENSKKQKASEEIQNNLTEEINRLCKKVTQLTKEKVLVK